MFNDRERVAQVARVMGANSMGVVDFEHFVGFIRTANQTAQRKQNDAPSNNNSMAAAAAVAAATLDDDNAV